VTPVTRLDCDIAVIGAGSGGLTVAAAAAQFGRKVVLIERGKMGGDCLNYGCVPSKALLAAARRAHQIRTSAGFGIAGREPLIDFTKVMAHVRGVIAAIEPNDSQERFEKLGATVIRATGRFRDGRTVEAGGHEIRARRFVVATGSSPAIPPIPGLATTRHFTNETVFDSDVLPRHLVIIGAGPIGLEMAQAYRRLGADVTVLESKAPLAKDDPELAQILLERLAAEGTTILPQVKIAEVRNIGSGVVADIEHKGERRAIEGSHLLVAAGRRPDIAELGLEAAGIEYTKSGITVDRGLKTTNPRVYAIGDAIGGLQFTHVANHHAVLVIKNALFRLPVNCATQSIPWVTYTDPELAHVGISEGEARAAGDDPKVLKWPFRENDRALTERETEGLVKVVLDARGRVRGVSILGSHAGELILPWVLMVANKRKIKAMIDPVFPYPTLSEASKRAALSNFTSLASKGWIRGVIDILAAFG
jgi:pyruvate/2-oxoglutarate dehydrogenase complex dihydrolipoamide dehydrogenase (E3) component